MLISWKQNLRGQNKHFKDENNKIPSFIKDKFGNYSHLKFENKTNQRTKNNT